LVAARVCPFCSRKIPDAQRRKRRQRRLVLTLFATVIIAVSAYTYLRVSAKGIEYWVWEQCMRTAEDQALKVFLDGSKEVRNIQISRQKGCTERSEQQAVIISGMGVGSRKAKMAEICSTLYIEFSSKARWLPGELAEWCDMEIANELWEIENPATARLSEISACVRRSLGEEVFWIHRNPCEWARNSDDLPYNGGRFDFSVQTRLTNHSIDYIGRFYHTK
jgi:hypothetical protein